MRTIVLSILALGILSFRLMSVPVPKDDPKPIPKPTAEQLAAAKEAYAKFGAGYITITNPKTKEICHLFNLSEKTTDADLTGLPNLPFHFGLILMSTKVTDAGVKELKELKNLTGMLENPSRRCPSV